MIVSTWMRLGSDFFFSGAGLMLAIAVLACVAGAEIACIFILIGKMRNASPNKKKGKAEVATEEEEENPSGLYGTLLAATAGGFVPMSVPVLTILAALTALLAVVMVILLAVCVKKGYVFAPIADKHKEEAPSEPMPYEPAEEPAREPLDVFDEPTSEPYIAEEPVTAFEEALPAFAEADEPVEEAVVEAPAIEEPVIEEAVGTVITEETAPVSAEGGIAPNGPVRVVEKVVTETYKEIIKEAPRTETGAAGDALLEKLTDFLDYEMQKRRENEAEATEQEDKPGAIQSPVQGQTYDAEDEDEDAEEDENDTDLTDEDAEGDEMADDESEDEEGDRFTGNERIIGFDEKTGCYIVAHYRKSFEAKLIQARPNIKSYYSDLKNALLSYKGTKSRISWTADSFHNGRTQLAKINVKTRILEIYLAIEPESLEGTVYRGKNVGNKKKYAETPFLYKIRTPRKFNWAMELVQRTCEEHGLTPIDIQPVDYTEQYPFDTTENLVERKLIKEYIRQEKPATSFELAEDHVTVVPEEDPTVIPANANFSWELDNERLEEKAEEEQEPVSEPESETPEPAPAPTPVAPAAPAEPAVIRETVKITETRYTEHYYADNTVEYDKTVLTNAPVPEELPAPAEPEESSFTADKFEGADDPFALYRYEDEELAETESEELEEVEPEATAEEAFVEEGEILEEESEDASEEALEETAEESAEEEEPDDEEPQFFAPEREAVEVIATEEELPDLSAYSEVDEETEEAYETLEESDAEESEEEASDAEEVDAEENYEELAEEEDEEYEEVEETPTPAPVEAPADPALAVVDICAMERHFPDGALINLEALKQAGLVQSTAKKLKIYATGDLRLSYTVEANHFTLDAIRAISMADGDVQMLV